MEQALSNFQPESVLTEILMLSQPSELLNLWSCALAKHYTLENTEVVPKNLSEYKIKSLIIAHSQVIEANKISVAQLKDVDVKILLVGENWPENKQIDALVAGASGYCELRVSTELILKAAASVIHGEIWLERHLIPQVIGTLMQSNPPAQKPDQDYETKKELLTTLSSRELDVAKLISSGKSNKRIASTLFISERTVKAHLTSIFKKMQVADRLHLAISLKSFEN